MKAKTALGTYGWFLWCWMLFSQMLQCFWPSFSTAGASWLYVGYMMNMMLCMSLCTNHFKWTSAAPLAVWTGIIGAVISQHWHLEKCDCLELDTLHRIYSCIDLIACFDLISSGKFTEIYRIIKSHGHFDNEYILWRKWDVSSAHQDGWKCCKNC